MYVLVLNMQIEDNITQEYRACAPKVPEPAAPPKKTNTKPPSASARKSKPVPNSDEMMEVVMNRFMQYMRNEMSQMADEVAEVTRPRFICFKYICSFKAMHVFIYNVLVCIAEIVKEDEQRWCFLQARDCSGRC